MIINKYSKMFAFTIALFSTLQSFGQEVLETEIAPNQAFVQATEDSKRSLKQTAKKYNLKRRDLIQGTLIGSALFGASFLTKDPTTKTILRVLAIAPMIIGILAPKKLVKKIGKLELDEAACSSDSCKGVCTKCKITKSYLAAIPLTFIPYSILWLFTNKPTVTPNADEPQNHTPDNQNNDQPIPEPSPRVDTQEVPVADEQDNQIDQVINNEPVELHADVQARPTNEPEVDENTTNEQPAQDMQPINDTLDELPIENNEANALRHAPLVQEENEQVDDKQNDSIEETNQNVIIEQSESEAQDGWFSNPIGRVTNWFDKGLTNIFYGNYDSE